jgi:hypothetical protein
MCICITILKALGRVDFSNGEFKTFFGGFTEIKNGVLPLRDSVLYKLVDDTGVITELKIKYAVTKPSSYYTEDADKYWSTYCAARNFDDPSMKYPQVEVEEMGVKMSPGSQEVPLIPGYRTPSSKARETPVFAPIVVPDTEARRSDKFYRVDGDASTVVMKIGTFSINEFNTVTRWKNALEKVKELGFKNLILDLGSNGGGLTRII